MYNNEYYVIIGDSNRWLPTFVQVSICNIMGLKSADTKNIKFDISFTNDISKYTINFTVNNPLETNNTFYISNDTYNIYLPNIYDACKNRTYFIIPDIVTIYKNLGQLPSTIPSGLNAILRSYSEPNLSICGAYQLMVPSSTNMTVYFGYKYAASGPITWYKATLT